MADFQKFLSSFDSSNLKGKQFEKFCKWFLENDTYWKSKFTKVYLWDDYPKRWGADLGIDLIAEADDGSLCAIQAKCYSPEYPVTKKDMDSFLSESNRKEISTRLLLASTDIIGGNARKVCQSQEKPVTFFLYSDFLNSTIEFPEDINKLTKPKLKQKPKPRPHQAEAIKNVLKGFKKNDRGQLIMACGTGKTFTTLWIKEKLNAETTLILLPSLNLLSQTLKEWYFGASKPFKSFAVCSDDSVTKSTEEDAVKESTQDLSFPVSADPKQIQSFLKQKGTKVIFSTYQSSPMIAEAMKSKTIPSFDLVICDEAHRCAGKVGSTFTTVLDDKKIRTKQKLFTTATPRTYSQSVKTIAKIKEIEITGMDDEEVFGPVFHKLSFGQAITNNPPLLTDYQVVVVVIDSPTIKDLVDERVLLEINPNDNIDSESLASQIGILKAIKDYELKRVISFHGRVNRAKNFSKDLPDVKKLISKNNLPKGELRTDFVSGQMPTNKRYQLLQELKELSSCDYYVLSNARCLSEGVDVPAIDGIAIIDPKKSKTDIVQTIGRAIRLSENKSKGTIIIPVFIGDGDDTEGKINNSNFSAVFDVLNALKAHDESLSFELDEIRTELGKRRVSTGPSKKIPKLILDIPSKYSSEFSDAIHTMVVEHTTASWNFWYGLLEDYFNKYNSSDVESRYITDDGYKLGLWVRNQRVYKQSEERIGKLNKLNFIWDKDRKNYSWEEYYKELEIFFKKYKHCDVKKGYTQNKLSLGNWVQNVRSGKRITCTNEQINLLNKINFIWDINEYEWNKSYEAIKKHLTLNKNIDKYTKTESGLPIGTWAGTQRLFFKKAILSKDRVDKLKAIGFDFEGKSAQWENSFQYLKKFKSEHGHLNVKVDFIDKDGFKLGRWVVAQRAKFNGNKLSKERIKKMNSIGFLWSPLDSIWDSNLDNLKKYFKEHGDTNVPKNYVSKSGFKLGNWVDKIRGKKSTYSKDRIKSLNELNFIWSKSEFEFNERLIALKEYKKIHNNIKVQRKYVTQNGIKLGAWVSNLKNHFKRLSKEQIMELEKLGVNFNK